MYHYVCICIYIIYICINYILYIKFPCASMYDRPTIKDNQLLDGWETLFVAPFAAPHFSYIEDMTGGWFQPL